MSLIYENQVSLARLREIFESRGLSVKLNEHDKYLEVNYPDLPDELEPKQSELIIWIDESARCVLMRVVIASCKERESIPKDELLEVIADLNQNHSCFGTFNAASYLGITTEYLIPYRDSISEDTILHASEMLVHSTSACSNIYVKKLLGQDPYRNFKSK